MQLKNYSRIIFRHNLFSRFSVYIVVVIILIGVGSAKAQNVQEISRFIQAYDAALVSKDIKKMHQLVNSIEQYDLYEIITTILKRAMYLRCQNDKHHALEAVAHSLADNYARKYSRKSMSTHVRSVLSLPNDRCQKYSRAWTFFYDAKNALNINRYRLADSLYSRSLELARQLRDKELEILNLNEIFYVQRKLNLDKIANNRAVEVITQAAELVYEVAYPGIEFAIFCNAGKANLEVQNYDMAVRFYGQCLEVSKRDSTNQTIQFLPYLGLIETTIALGKNQMSKSYWRSVLKIKHSQDKATFFEQAIRLASKAGLSGAMELFKEILAGVKDYTYAPGLSLNNRFHAMSCMGIAYQSGNMADSARHYFKQALALSHGLNDNEAVAIAYLGIGQAEISLNRLVEASQALRDGYSYLENSKPSYIKLQILLKLAQVNLQNGNFTQWGKLVSKAYNDAISADLHEDAADIAIEIIEISLAMAKFDQADIFIKKILTKELQCSSNKRALAYAMRAELRKKQGKLDLSVTDYKAALNIFKELKNKRDILLTNLNIASLYLDLEKISQAESYLNQVSISDRTSDRTLALKARTIRARIMEHKGDQIKAINEFASVYDYLKESAFYELFSLNKDVTMQQAQFRANGQAYADMLLRAADKTKRQDYAKLAFIVTEESKSINFQKIMARYLASRSSSINNITRSKIDQFNTLLLRKSAIEREQQELQASFIPSLQKSITSIDSQLVSLSHEIKKKLPIFENLTVEMENVAALQDILDTKEAVVSYRVGYNQLIAFIITRKKFQYETIPISRADLRVKVREVLQGVRNVEDYHDLRKFAPTKAQQLYRLIFYPLEQHLQSIEKLILVSDDILYTFPFEILVTSISKIPIAPGQAKVPFLSEYTGIRYLVDKEYSISYIPSLSVLFALRRLPESGHWHHNFIGFADPDFHNLNESLRTIELSAKAGGHDSTGNKRLIVYRKRIKDLAFSQLKHTHNEAVAIAKIVGAPSQNLYLGQHATESNVYKAPLSSTRFLLFATHGIMPGEDNGMDEVALALSTRSAIKASDDRFDGLLTASEIMGLNLSAELVVLSACETAGEIDRSEQGEGFLGLTRAFMYAGARNLMVSHWSIDSPSTQKLVSVFFHKLTKEQGTGDLALRNSKQWLRSQIDTYTDHPSGQISYAHPFFWAPFVLVGDF